MMKKVFALLLIPMLASACIRVNNVPDESQETSIRSLKPMALFFISAKDRETPTMY